MQTTAAESDEGEVRLTVADLEGELDPGSDAVILASGHPTLTSISAVGEAPMPAGITAEIS